MTQIIDTVEFDKWRTETSVLYAAETLSHGGTQARLSFSVGLDRTYCVKWGDQTLYVGTNFTNARRAYENAGKGLRLGDEVQP